MVHTVPGLAWIVNSLITNTILHRGILKIIYVTTAVYCSINCVATKVKGVPIYDFMHWESFQTPLLICGITGAFSIIYLWLCFIDEKLKWQLAKKRTESITLEEFDKVESKNK